MVLLLILPISAPTQSSCVIVIVAKISHIVEVIGVDVFAPFSVVVSDVVHIFLIEECVSDCEKERIVQTGIQ